MSPRDCPLGRWLSTDWSPRQQTEVLIHKTQTLTDPILGRDVKFHAQWREWSHAGWTASIKIQGGFGQATAQQRTSRLRVNLCLSTTQAAGLAPPLNGQREKTSEDTSMGKHPGCYYSVCRAHTPQKRLKGGSRKG